jgi:uncharacterized metal-binding protein
MIIPQCAQCGLRRDQQVCRIEGGKGPEFCPTINQQETIERAKLKYLDPDTMEFAKQASLQEGSCYIERDIQPHILHPVKPRLQEICEFAERMGYQRLGLAFCTGLQKEAALLTRILERNDFKVISVNCKVGRVPKEYIGIKDEEKVCIGGFEAMCNPIGQAEILNQSGTELNIMFGLCVGHDSLFLKNVRAMTTVFAVKDRVLGHNPMGALYTSETYYQRFLRKRQAIE